jgi:hypothetical protein
VFTDEVHAPWGAYDHDLILPRRDVGKCLEESVDERGSGQGSGRLHGLMVRASAAVRSPLELAEQDADAPLPREGYDGRGVIGRRRNL